MPALYHGTELSAQELCDALYLCYAQTSPDLPPHCDGCGQQFSVHNGLACTLGGLVLAHHNELNDELADLASRAFTPSAVWDELLIHPCPGCPVVTPTPPAPSAFSSSPSIPSDDLGDLLIHGLWSYGTDCILDVWITNMDAKTYQSKDPLKVLSFHEKAKKKKYLAPCLTQWHHFTPFIMSADGLLGHEADAVVCKLAFTYAEKLTNHTQWSVALCAITLALPFFRSPTAVFEAPRFPLYEFSPSSMAGWCRPESVPQVISDFPYYLLYSSSCFLSSLPLGSTPSILTLPCFSSSCFTGLSDTPGLWWPFPTIFYIIFNSSTVFWS